MKEDLGDIDLWGYEGPLCFEDNRKTHITFITLEKNKGKLNGYFQDKETPGFEGEN